jgi:hypothetical protein
MKKAKHTKRIVKKHSRVSKGTSESLQEFPKLTMTRPLQASIESFVDQPSLRNAFGFIGQLVIEVGVIKCERLWFEYDPKTYAAHKQIMALTELPEISADADAMKWLNRANNVAIGCGFVNVAAGVRKDHKWVR